MSRVATEIRHVIAPVGDASFGSSSSVANRRRRSVPSIRRPLVVQGKWNAPAHGRPQSVWSRPVKSTKCAPSSFFDMAGGGGCTTRRQRATKCDAASAFFVCYYAALSLCHSSEPKSSEVGSATTLNKDSWRCTIAKARKPRLRMTCLTEGPCAGRNKREDNYVSARPFFA
jgi:hypothetical protein